MIKVEFQSIGKDEKSLSNKAKFYLNLILECKVYIVGWLSSFKTFLHTVKLRAVDQSTIQFWTLLAKGYSTLVYRIDVQDQINVQVEQY